MRVLVLVSRDRRRPSKIRGDIGLWERGSIPSPAGHAATVIASTFPEAQGDQTIDGFEATRFGEMQRDVQVLVVVAPRIQVLRLAKP